MTVDELRRELIASASNAAGLKWRANTHAARVDDLSSSLKMEQARVEEAEKRMRGAQRASAARLSPLMRAACSPQTVDLCSLHGAVQLPPCLYKQCPIASHTYTLACYCKALGKPR